MTVVSIVSDNNPKVLVTIPYSKNLSRVVEMDRELADLLVEDGTLQRDVIDGCYNTVSNMEQRAWAFCSTTEVPGLEIGISISASYVARFDSEVFDRKSTLRWGQAFHQYMKLDRLTGHKVWADILYNADEKLARAMVASVTNWET